MIYKLASEVLDVEPSSRTVKAVWAVTDMVDSSGDIIISGAFDKTIRESGPQGKNRIWSLVEHNWQLDKALGKPNQLYMEGNRLIAVTVLADTKFASDILALYDNGAITEHSAGMLVPKDKIEQKGQQRLIKEVILKEGSAALWGVNDNTPTLSVSKSEIEVIQKATKDRIEALCKVLRHGNISDEMAQLIEIELKSIYSTLPEITTEPQKTDLSQFGQILKTFKLH